MKNSISIFTKRDKTIIQEMYDDEDKIELTTKNKVIRNDNFFSNMFKYNETELLILNIDDEFWFKGKELAILLGYLDPKKALQNNIKSELKKSYGDLLSLTGGKIQALQNVSIQAMFLNENGMYKLIFKSNKPEAEQFTDWVTTVLKTIRKTGSYSTKNDPPKQIEYKSFYDTHTISTFEGKNTIYIGYVGEYNNETLFKYGITSCIFRRDIREHQKLFDNFQLLYVKETDNNRTIEHQFEKELICKNLYRKLKIKNKTQRELFTISKKYAYDDIVSLLDNLIAEFKLPIIKERDEKAIIYENEINQLKITNDNLKKLNRTIKK